MTGGTTNTGGGGGGKLCVIAGVAVAIVYMSIGFAHAGGMAGAAGAAGAAAI